MIIDFSPTDGTARCLHSDLIPLQSIGTLTVRRASMVEFREDIQEWIVRTPKTIFKPSRTLFHSPSRAECLEWEELHFEELI